MKITANMECPNCHQHVLMTLDDGLPPHQRDETCGIEITVRCQACYHEMTWRREPLRAVMDMRHEWPAWASGED